MINDFQLISTLVIRSLMLTVMIRAQPNQLNRGLIDTMANQLSMIPTNQHPLVIFNIAMGSYQFLDDVHAYYKKIHSHFKCQSVRWYQRVSHEQTSIMNLTYPTRRYVCPGVPMSAWLGWCQIPDFSGGKVAFEAHVISSDNFKWKDAPFSIGKSSISMGHLYHSIHSIHSNETISWISQNVAGKSHLL